MVENNYQKEIFDSNGRPDWNQNSFKYSKYTDRSNKRNCSFISANTLSENIIKNKINLVKNSVNYSVNYSVIKPIKKIKSIRGLCEVDGRIEKLLADTGASRSILSVEYLVDNKNLKPFTKKAVTANNGELNIDGEKNCIIKLGNEVSQTNVLISPELKDEFLMGIDYLETCELTKPHIGLRKAIEDASYQLYKELDLKENILPF